MTTRTIAMRNYMGLLNSLSDDMKLALLEGLAKSIGGKRKKQKLSSLFGAWEDDKSADEILNNIRASRITGTRDIELFE